MRSSAGSFMRVGFLALVCCFGAASALSVGLKDAKGVEWRTGRLKGFADCVVYLLWWRVGLWAV